ncbi:MAG TPA: hypothetical protein VN787_04150 [Steroidobacteraceae bacterium]|nr:hypothetical protein [Steroidobacteraceae bacterium]
MDIRLIEQKQLVERYLLGRLTPPEAKFFERMVRDSPELAERIGLPEALRRTMRLLDETGTEWREQPPRFWRQPWLVAGLAAALLAAIGIAVALWAGKRDAAASYLQLKGEAERGLLVAPTRSALLDLHPARPSESAPSYLIGTRTAPTLADLRVDVSYVHASLFKVVIKRDDGTYWARLDNQLRDSNGSLRLAFNTAAFAAGTYEVEIEAVDLHGNVVPAGRLRLRIDRG